MVAKVHHTHLSLTVEPRPELDQTVVVVMCTRSGHRIVLRDTYEECRRPLAGNFTFRPKDALLSAGSGR